MKTFKRQNINVNTGTSETHFDIDITHKNTVKVNIFDAIKERNIDLVKLYVNAGGDVNVISNKNETPIIYAIKEGWTGSEIKEFLDLAEPKKIDLTFRNNKIIDHSLNTGNPFELAYKNSKADVLTVLAEYNNGIKVGTDIIFSGNTVGGTPDVKAALALHLDFSSLKHYHYGGKFEQFKEAGILHSTFSVSEEDFHSIIAHLQEFNVSQAARSLALNIACHKFGYDSEQVNSLVDSGFFKDFSGYLLDKSIYTSYKNPKIFEKEHFNFYLKHVNDLDKFIIDFSKLNQTQNFKAGYELLDYLYDFRAEKTGVPAPQDDSGTIYITDVVDVHIDGDLNFPNDDKQASIAIEACIGEQCAYFGLNVSQELIPHVIDGIVT